MSQRAEGYAQAVVAVAEAEGGLDRVPDELAALGRAVAENEELRTVLADRTIPASRRIGVVEELLGDRASPVTLNLAAMLVGVGRGSELTDIAGEALEQSAAKRGQALAEVRSAVPLSDEQTERVAAALSRATKLNVTVHVAVDPDILGGIVAQIGDTVFDGSVRTRLDKMKERMS